MFSIERYQFAPQLKADTHVCKLIMGLCKTKQFASFHLSHTHTHLSTLQALREDTSSVTSESSNDDHDDVKGPKGAKRRLLEWLLKYCLTILRFEHQCRKRKHYWPNKKSGLRVIPHSHIPTRSHASVTLSFGKSPQQPHSAVTL